MIKAIAISKFNLADWDKIKIQKRANESDNLKGIIYKDDVIECNKEMADYLLGNNNYKREFIKILEYIPEEPIEKPKRKRVSKK